MTDPHEPEHTDADLIDELRSEILQEEGQDVETPLIPDAIVALVGVAAESADVALAVDELLVEDDTISATLHARLVSRVRAEVAGRASRPRYLEQIVRAERQHQELSIDDLAVRIDATPAAINAIESAQAGFDELSEETVAAWIEELQLDLDMAATALESSLLQPATAYHGHERPRNKRNAEDFVQNVRRILIARRSK